MKLLIRPLTIFLAALFQLFYGTAGAELKPAPKAEIKNRCALLYLNGIKPNFLNRNLADQSRELCLDNFVVMYSSISHTPLWAAEHLTTEMVVQAEHPLQTDEAKNKREPMAKANPEYRNYGNAPYQIGCMAPPEDMPTVRAQRQCHTLANLVPVSRDGNAGVWKPVENAVREYVKNDGELYVITGALFISDPPLRLNERFLIPTHLYKVVFDPRKNMGAAYFIRNEEKATLQVIAINQLEKVAGIEFFHNLPEASKQKLLKLPKPKLPF